MKFLEYSDTLDTGVGAMNEEHKHLIGIMNKLHDQFEAKKDFNTLIATFNDLANYTVKHFDDEEKYMASINYPKLETHRGVHKNLLNQVMGFKKSFIAKQEISPDIFPFLKTWLVSHIKGIDVQYGKHNQPTP